MRCSGRVMAAVAVSAALFSGGIPATASPAARVHESHSRNWAGFLGLHRAHHAAIAAVGLTLAVPQVNCPRSARREASFWAGLGGVSEPLYQDGVRASCRNGRAHYAAWFEAVEPTLAPMTEQDLVGASVRAGDVVTTSVERLVHHRYRFTLVDRGPPGSRKPKWRYVHTLTAASTSIPTSAECIVERPLSSNTGRLFPLADFGRLVLPHRACRATVAGRPSSLFGDEATPLMLRRYDMYAGRRLLARASRAGAHGGRIVWRHAR